MLSLISMILMSMAPSAHAAAGCDEDILNWGEREHRLSAVLEGAWARLGGEDGRAVAKDLFTRHAEPHRAYHDLRRIDECLWHLNFYFAQDPESTVDRDVLTVALFFRTAVFKPDWASDDERASAFLFLHHSTGIATEHARHVENLIMVARTQTATTEAERVFADLELTILGADLDRLTEYELALRSEYESTSSLVYRERRGRVLRELAARAPLYQTTYFRHQLERRAKANLRILTNVPGKR